MLIYVDMDGVLTDLDEHVARRADVAPDRMLKDRAMRGQLIRNSIRSQWIEHWTALGAPNQVEWRRIIRRWRSEGHTVEILTSYGLKNMSFFHEGRLYQPWEMEYIAHQGKVDWLVANYGELLQEGSISAFNGVPSCEMKARYAGPGTLLIDDQPENVEGFRAAGGQAVQYEASRHHEIMSQLEVL